MDRENLNTETSVVDEQEEERQLVGKTPEERKMRELMRQRLSTTSIPDLVFEDSDGSYTKFSDIYDYHHFLGCGAFGFVVAALDKESGESLALKVNNLYFIIST